MSLPIRDRFQPCHAGRRRSYLQKILVIALLSLMAVNPAIAQVSSNCPHIRILGPDNTDEVHYSLSDDVILAGPTQRRVVGEAFDMASPLLCRAVQRVVFVNDTDNKGTSGRNKSNNRQDLIYLNAAAPKFQEQVLKLSERARVEAKQTILHEATHAASRLLYTRSEESPPAWLEWRPDEDLWGAEALSLADQTIDDMRLEKGLFQEWDRMHNAFVRQGLADNYYGDEWTQILGESPGFASTYGGEDTAEDIAEIVSWALISKLFEGVAGEQTYPTENRACLAMQKEPGPGIPSKLAAVFTKVGFAHSAGFITDEVYDDCVGNLKIRGKQSGFFSLEAGKQVKQYTQDVKGRLGRIGDNGAWFFEVKAKGTVGISDEGMKPARIRLTLETSPATEELEKVSFPRGLYRIGPGANAFNTLQIIYTDGGEEKIGIEIYEADVLIGRASHKLVEGTVFIKRYFNYTELFKKLPQVPKKERIITFRKEN